MTYEQLLNKLIEGENFSFARYGDGEINAILGSKQPQNCDGHQYFDDLGIRLYNIIKSKPDYIMGLQGLAQRQRANDESFHKLIEGIDWINADIIHHASIKGDLYGLFEALEGRKVMLVSKLGLEGIGLEMPLISHMKHIVINEKDCWLQYEEIFDRIMLNMKCNIVVLYCAGMPAEVFIDDVYKVLGNTVTQIDIGSAFDPYCGLSIRRYHDDVIKKL